MAQQPDAPIGDAERDEAVERLDALHRDGLLGPHDFEDRRGRARDAATRGDLDAVFRDLPEAGAPGPPAPVAGVPAPAPGAPVGHGSALPDSGTWFTKTRRDALSWIVVLGSVFLFFRTGSWLWFLLIPASAAVWQLFSGREDRD
jgi:hypothetical protein